MQMARSSAALLCVLLYHAAPALAFVAPGALAPGRPALQVPLRSRDRHARSGASTKEEGTCAGAVLSRCTTRARWSLVPLASSGLTVALACFAPPRALTRSQKMTFSAVRGLRRALAESGQGTARLVAPLPTMMADAAAAPTTKGKAVLIFSW